jgi:hypothetical protein
MRTRENRGLQSGEYVNRQTLTHHNHCRSNHPAESPIADLGGDQEQYGQCPCSMDMHDDGFRRPFHLDARQSTWRGGRR